ncbi:MAG TPA: alkaline phosphatase D family protein [Methylomirabilota bacterium]
MSTVPPGPAMTATTPSLGVRQWHEDRSKGTIRIAWASAGGRGMPRTVILVPVVHDGAKWARSPALIEKLRGDPHGTWSALGRLAPRSVDVFREGDEDPTRDPAAPRAVSIRDDYGERWGADHLLVLMIYDGPPAIGEQGDVRGLAAPDAADDERKRGQEIEAVNRFFEKYDPRIVTRGLVRLPSRGRDKASDTVVFALASCQYPADLTDGAPGDHGGPDAPASASLVRLSQLLAPNGPGEAQPESPSLLVLAGDQVYVDATAGLFDARTRSDRLRLPYQNLMRSPGTQAVFGLLPVAMVLDDHELVDNWEPGVPMPPPTTKEQHMSEYRRFQRMAGPPLRNKRALWCDFAHSEVPFFLADTRSERNAPGGANRHVGNWLEARIMGDDQWEALQTFLVEHKEQVSFVVSPSMLLPRDLGLLREPSLALECDDWDGFPASRDALLAFLCEHDMRRVVFLSGDAHTSCVAEATVRSDGHEARLWSVHSSGLYCPYPFANGTQDNYACNEQFVFHVATEPRGPRRPYECDIRSLMWEPGDGFATLALRRSGSGHQLDIRFHRAHPTEPVEVQIPG